LLYNEFSTEEIHEDVLVNGSNEGIRLLRARCDRPEASGHRKIHAEISKAFQKQFGKIEIG
jgi:hypothetical protein